MTTYLAQGGGFSVLQSLQNAFDTFVGYLPRLLGALLVLIVGYLIAKVLQKVLTKVLNKLRLDDRLTEGRGGQYVSRFSPDGSPARLVGLVVFWVLMLFVISAAVSTLNIPALTQFMNTVISYLPNVIAALLIFMVAAAVAGAVGGLAHRLFGDTPTGRVVRTAAPSLVMAIAVFMMLTQLNIAPFIVAATYVALIGALALGAALAFGLGGRQAAEELINSGYRQAQEHSEQLKHDSRIARERGRRDAETARERAEGQVGEQETPTGGSYRAT